MLIDPYRFGRSDPLFALVQLLLNGTTTLTDDQSSFDRGLTAVGSVALNSTVTLFGNPTYATPAAVGGSFLQLDSVLWAGSFNALEFCLEGFHYPVQDTGDYNIFRIGALFKGETLAGANKLFLSCTNINSTSYTLDTGASSLSLNTWIYYALVRDNSIAGPSDFLRLYAGPVGGTATQRGSFSFTKGVGVGASLGSPKEAMGYDFNRDAGRQGPFRFTLGNGGGRYYGGTSFPVPAAPFPAR